MNLIPVRIQTILTSVVSWLILATVAAQAVIGELGGEFPDIVSPLARAITIVGGIVLVIRRVSPVEGAWNPGVKSTKGLVS